MQPRASAAPPRVVDGGSAERAYLGRVSRQRAPIDPLGVHSIRRHAPGWTVAALWVMVLLYFAALGLLALWPTEVDVPARPLLASITAEWPWLTYARIEFAANVFLFAPFGFLFTLILRRARFIVLPIAVLISSAIETWQYVVDGRNSSVLDIVANSAGASIGILCAAFILLVTSRSRASR